MRRYANNLYVLRNHYQDDKAVINIRACEISEGKLPTKQTKLVLAWAEIHREELLADWELASKGELPSPIEPLKEEGDQCIYQ